MADARMAHRDVTKNEQIKLGGLVIDFDNRQVIKGQQVETLNWKNFSVLAKLVKNREEVVSREVLIKEIWDDNFVVGDKALTTVIWHLRKTLESSGVVIETIPKRGYRLKVVSIPQVEDEQPTTTPTQRKLRSIIKPVALTVLLTSTALMLYFWFFTDQQTTTRSTPSIAVFASWSGALREDQGAKVLEEISSRLQRDHHLKLVSPQVKQQVLSSENRKSAALDHGIAQLIYLTFNRTTNDQLNISIKLEETAKMQYTTSTITMDQIKIEPIVEHIVTKLPQQDWR